MGSTSEHVAGDRAGIQAEAAGVMGRLCAALAGVLDALPERADRAVDVGRVLGLNAPLAWQVYRMATAAAPLESVAYLPTSNQISRVAEAARKVIGDDAAGAKAVEALERASTELDEFIRTHARDRREFESLAGSLASAAGGSGSGAGVGAIDMKHRRALFRSNAHVWGIQARAGYAAMIVHEEPGKDGETVMIGGYSGLHVLRPDVPMLCSVRTGVRTHEDESSEAQHVESGAVGSKVLPPAGQTRLIPGVDSRLRLAAAGAEDGEAVSMVKFPGIGRRAAVSFFLEQSYAAGVRKSRHEGHTISSQVRVPSEALVLDLLVPAGSGLGEAKVTTYGRRQGVDRVWERREIDILPTSERAVCVRGVSDVPVSADVPRLPEIIGGVLERRGWAGKPWDVYRCRVEYPILHALVEVRVGRSKSEG